MSGIATSARYFVGGIGIMSSVKPQVRANREDGWRHGQEPSFLSEMLWILGIFAGAFALVALFAAM